MLYASRSVYLCRVDELVEPEGHVVHRLPPYTELNGNESAWRKFKDCVARESKTLNMASLAPEQVTADK